MSNEFTFTDLMNPNEHERKKTNTTYIPIDEIKENNKNNYELVDIDKLAESIYDLGILQPLLVKQKNKYEYELVAGHRRYNAIKQLVEEGKYPADYEILCKKIVDDENELITRLKLHETNLQTRSLLKMSEDEKIAIVDDYMDIIKKAKEQNLTINGKPIKGKTRDLIAERFNISARTAQDIITKTKEKKEGGKIATLEEEDEKSDKKQVTNTDRLNKIIKQIERMEFDKTEEETKAKEKIIELLS